MAVSDTDNRNRATRVWELTQQIRDVVVELHDAKTVWDNQFRGVETAMTKAYGGSMTSTAAFAPVTLSTFDGKHAWDVRMCALMQMLLTGPGLATLPEYVFLSSLVLEQKMPADAFDAKFGLPAGLTFELHVSHWTKDLMDGNGAFEGITETARRDVLRGHIRELHQQRVAFEMIGQAVRHVTAMLHSFEATFHAVAALEHDPAQMDKVTAKLIQHWSKIILSVDASTVAKQISVRDRAHKSWIDDDP